MSCSPEVFTYGQVGVIMASLDHTISVSTESLLCPLPCLSTVLWPIRAGPISLGAGANVKQVAGGALMPQIGKSSLVLLMVTDFRTWPSLRLV